MNFFRPRRIFSISTLRRDIDTQIDQELAFHLDVRTQELIDEGWEPHAARSEAERLFGDYEAIRTRCREIGARRVKRMSRMERAEGWVQDIRFGLRQLRRNPAFATVAVLTLGLGVGAITAIFSILNGVLLKPLPYTEPDGLIRVWVAPERDRMSGLDFHDIQNELPTVERLVGVNTGAVTITGEGAPFIARVGRVTEGLLEMFQLAPHLGRDLPFTESELDLRAEAVIAYGLWQRLFGADPDIVGRSIEVNSESLQIIGVAPPDFDFPSEAELWIPRPVVTEGCARGCHTWFTLGRLSPGATVPQVQAGVDALARTLETTYPETNTNKTFRVVTLQEDLVGDVRRGLWILLGAVAAVLLIACANVANLLLVRATGREGEMAVRGAMGATRSRLVRQTLIESGVLATVGGVLGLGVAYLGITGIRHLAGDSIPRIETVSVDAQAALFTVVIVALVTLLFGLSPALRSAEDSLGLALRESSRSNQSKRWHRQRRLLVGAEMALSVVLLVAAGLFLRTFAKLHAVDLGYRTQDVVRFGINLPDGRYENLDQIRTFYRTLEGQLGALPGVQSVGSIFGAPLGSGSVFGDVLVEGRPEPELGTDMGANVRPVSPGYLETMDIGLVRGRLLTRADDADALPAAVVNEAFVRKVFPNEDPVGKRVEVTVDFGFGAPQWTIVGVVEDIRSRSITTEPAAEIYVPHGMFGPDFMTMTMSMAPGVIPPIDAVRRQVQALDSELPIRSLETVEQAIADDVAPTRFYLLLVAAFAALALLLAAVGLYGVLAYTVSTRTREIGVRVALGADRRRITRMVVLDGLRPAMVGVVAGLAIALLGGRVLESVLFGVAPRDPLVLLSVPVVLFGVAIAAALIPATRAGRLNPSDALRAD